MVDVALPACRCDHRLSASILTMRTRSRALTSTCSPGSGARADAAAQGQHHRGDDATVRITAATSNGSRNSVNSACASHVVLDMPAAAAVFGRRRHCHRAHADQRQHLDQHHHRHHQPDRQVARHSLRAARRDPRPASSPRTGTAPSPRRRRPAPARAEELGAGEQPGARHREERQHQQQRGMHRIAHA